MGALVHTADVNRNGHFDVLGAAYAHNAITEWRNDGGDLVNWNKQNIDINFSGALTGCASDFDKDGYTDVWGTADNLSEISWWPNNGGNPIVWENQENPP
jgi:hypothetical protein